MIPLRVQDHRIEAFLARPDRQGVGVRGHLEAQGGQPPRQDLDP